MDLDDFIKECQCGALIPLTSKVCEFCGFDFKPRILSEREQNYPFSSLIKDINNAFFRLENFLSGTLKEYKSFPFIAAFDMFFTKAMMPENYAPDTLKLADDYWNLTEQIRVDCDKGYYDTTDLDEDDDWQKDLNAIHRINNQSWRFIELNPKQALLESEQRFTIDAIIKGQKSLPNQIIDQSNSLFDEIVDLFSQLEHLNFKLDEGKQIDLDLDQYSYELYTKKNLLNRKLQKFFLSNNDDACNQFASKITKELAHIKESLSYSQEFGIRLLFNEKYYLVEPETLTGYIKITVNCIDKLKTFLNRYIILSPVIESSPEQSVKLSLRYIALIYCYQNKFITKGVVANRIAKEYGHNSGDKLYQHYSYYSDRRHRINWYDGSDITFNKQVKILEDLSNSNLLNQKQKHTVLDELKILKAKLE